MRRGRRSPPWACLRALLAGLAALLGIGAPASGEPVPTIPLEEVAPGQRGYGLSVFRGADPERFEVEILGVMRNVQPDTSYILARLSGRGLEETGVIAGMSGSPVYLDGRLAGAVSFGWPFSSEQIAGITPIGAMRELAGAAAPSRPAPGPRSDTLDRLLGGRLDAEELFTERLRRLQPALPLGGAHGVQWIALGFRGESERFLRAGLAPLTAAGEAAEGSPADLAPGSAVAGVLVDGDFRLAATGTVTDRLGDEVLAFGHAFLGLGPVRVPMATAEVVTVVPNQWSSFKVANYGQVVGAFDLDRQAGIRGRLGARAATVPLAVSIRGATERQFRLAVAEIPSITSLLLAISTLACLDTASQAQGAQGIDLEARFDLGERGPLAMRQSFDGEGAGLEAAVYLFAVSEFLLQNGLERVELAGLAVDLVQHEQPRSARLVGAHASQTLARPGDRIALNLDLVAYGGEARRTSLEVEVPAGLPAGRYSLLVGDGFSMDVARLQLERAQPVSFAQALELLRGLHSRREIVVLGVMQGQGLAVAGEVLPQLPGSLRSIWGAAASGSALPLRLAVSQERVQPLEFPVEGAVRIDLEVRRREPVGPEATGGEGVTEDGAPADSEDVEDGEDDEGDGDDGSAGGRRSGAPSRRLAGAEGGVR